jgi:hypothetical protein
MVRIAICQAAFDAIAKTLPLGSSCGSRRKAREARFFHRERIRFAVIQGLASLATLGGAICSAFAAYHWYQAAQVKDPPSALVGYAAWSGRGQPAPNAGVDASPLVKYVQDNAKRNKTAASWSAAAAAFAGLGWMLGLFG